MNNDYKPTYDIYGIPKPPDPSLWRKGVCTIYPGSTYGCACPKCNREMIENLDKELGTAPAPALTLGYDDQPYTAETVPDAPAPAGGEVFDHQLLDEGYRFLRNHESIEEAERVYKDFYEKHDAFIAATEARVRAEVWGKALYIASYTAKSLYGETSGLDLRSEGAGAKLVMDSLMDAAKSDGIDLTSLTN